MEDTKQQQILIVDDQPTNIKVLCDFLIHSGFDILVAKNGEAAIKKLQKASPDIILLDVMMPGIDGFETCRRLKASPATRDIPVIFMTVLSETVDKVKGLTIGGVDYITKPIQQEEVLARINVHLRLRSLTKQLQESKEAAEKAKEAAETANLAKSEFLKNVSHELRTPLNPILGFAQILQSSKTMTAEELEQIRIIYQTGKHLLTLIDDILDFSKIEAHKMELYLTDFSFPSFLNKVLEICRIWAEQKGIYLTYQPTSQLPTFIHADEKRLRQVLINLLGNAIKFTNTGGVTFKVGVIGNGKWLSQTEPGNEAKIQNQKIRFQIEDTGIGMNPEQLEKIFLPFEQLENAKHKAEGTGLGLTISQKLIQMMGSTLKVNSQPGVGSVFWMDLDLTENKALAQTAKSEQTSDSKPRKLDPDLAQKQPLRILLAEDNLLNQKVTLHLLKRLGYRVDVANNGQEVLLSLRRQSYDVILMDVKMPVMDGLEATRRICEEWPEASRPRIIAMTANAMPEHREECLAAGMDDYISKPFRVETIVKTLLKCGGLQNPYPQ
ncbi:MAG: response regulator [Xenococcaceae cyanobacterium]